MRAVQKRYIHTLESSHEGKYIVNEILKRIGVLFSFVFVYCVSYVFVYCFSHVQYAVVMHVSSTHWFSHVYVHSFSYAFVYRVAQVFVYCFSHVQYAVVMHVYNIHRCSVLQCGAVCCNVLQCVAVCCSVLQCVAVYCRSYGVATNHKLVNW